MRLKLAHFINPFLLREGEEKEIFFLDKKKLYYSFEKLSKLSRVCNNKNMQSKMFLFVKIDVTLTWLL